MAQIINGSTDQMLSKFQELEIPISGDTVNYQTTVTIPGYGEVTLKIDFAPFDLDSDGVLEECSGNTLDMPICARTWLNDTPIMAALINERPTDDNNGAGEIRLNTSAVDEFLYEFELAVVYDHSDPANKSTTMYVNGRPAEESGDIVNGNFSLRQAGANDDSAKKLVQMRSQFLSHPAGFDDLKYTCQWIEELPYISLSSETSIGGAVSGQADGICLEIATASTVDTANCLDPDIDVSGLDYIDLASELDYVWPDIPGPTF